MKRHSMTALGAALMVAGWSNFSLADERPAAGPPLVPPVIQSALKDLEDDWGALTTAHNRTARDTDKLAVALREAYATIDKLTAENERLKKK